MLNESALRERLSSFNISGSAESVIRGIRSTEPIRRVKGRRGNVIVRYASAKMGLTIQAESYTVELPYIMQIEFDPNVLEYYDQPCKIKLQYHDKNGRTVTVRHTPDFFIITRYGAGWIECKTEEELQELAKKMPNRYVRDPDGTWHCPPGEERAAKYGFFYKIFSSHDISWVYQRNINWLEDYLTSEEPRVVAPNVAEAIMGTVTSPTGVTLADLLDEMHGTATVDDVGWLIAERRIYVDLHATPLADYDRARLFVSEEMACATIIAEKAARGMAVTNAPIFDAAHGMSVMWDGQPYTIVGLGETETTLMHVRPDGEAALIALPNGAFAALVRDGKITCAAKASPLGMTDEGVRILMGAGSKDLERANDRANACALYIGGAGPHDTSPGQARTTPHNLCPRTIRDWLTKWHHAEQIYGNGYIGLIDACRRKGNRSPRVSKDMIEKIEAYIGKEYDTLKNLTKIAAYRKYVGACKSEGLDYTSYPYFVGRIAERDPATTARARAGERAAYQQEQFYWELTTTTPRHGDRPWEIVHIDHTELDIELVSRMGHRLGKPWMTLMMDANTRKILAVWLSFQRPSRVACMMILRACVYRHGRLPQTIVVDNGTEFNSVYFESLLAAYRVHKRSRPGAQPRFGSVCERLFGTTNTEFVHTLMGNTQLMKQPRTVTKAVDPAEHAVWDIASLYRRLLEWVDIYNTTPHQALLETPEQAYQRGLRQGGARAHRFIRYDGNFVIQTLPSTPKGTAKVLDNGRGVKINNLLYSCSALRSSKLYGTRVEVRYDPLDMGTAYAYIEGLKAWVTCISQYHSRFAGRSQREIEAASAELRASQQAHARSGTVTALRLARFLESLEAEEAVLTERLRAAEGRLVLTMVEAGKPGVWYQDDGECEWSSRQRDDHSHMSIASELDAPPMRVEEPDLDSQPGEPPVRVTIAPTMEEDMTDDDEVDSGDTHDIYSSFTLSDDETVEIGSSAL